MNMTYLHHSGFQIETKHSVLLFDYYTQNGMFDRVNEGDFPHKKFYIFVSHGHGDHYDPAILRWADRAHYILSDDVELPKDFKGEVTWVKPHRNTGFQRPGCCFCGESSRQTYCIPCRGFELVALERRKRRIQ